MGGDVTLRRHHWLRRLGALGRGTCNPPLAHRALSHDGRASLMLPGIVTVEAAGDETSIVRILDFAAMLGVGGMDQDPVLSEVANEARSRLRRVAPALGM